MKKYLEAGKIINKRGLKGELKVDSYCDTPEDFAQIKAFYLDENGENKFDVITSKPYNGFVYVLLSGVNTPELADKMRGKILYADRDDINIEEGCYFLDDLIGLTVYDVDTNKVYGTVTEIANHGASDIYTVSNGNAEFYLPGVDEFIIDVDFEKGIAVRPIPGIFDEAENV